jgi:hypothetical protein
VGDEIIVKGIQRYGLRAMPYKRRRKLDPEHDTSLCVLAGMKKVEDVKAYIAAAADADEPAFVMVSGKSGAGRTSVCNHLLATYRAARGIPSENFAVPRMKVAGDDDYVVMKNWITALYGDLQFRPGLTPLGKAGAVDLDVALDTLDGLMRETYRTKAAIWMKLTAQTLARGNKPAGFGVCLEDVPSFLTVEAAVSIFESVPTLVLFTVFDHQQGVRDQFEALQVNTTTLPPAIDSYPVLQLYDIAGQDAEELIQSRWPDESKPSPFDGAQLASAFVTPRSAGRIMVLTGRLLERKAAHPGPKWPTAEELRFAPDGLPDEVADLDQWTKEI